MGYHNIELLFFNPQGIGQLLVVYGPFHSANKNTESSISIYSNYSTKGKKKDLIERSLVLQSFKILNPYSNLKFLILYIKR